MSFYFIGYIYLCKRYTYSGQYVWLVDILRHYKYLSYKEINDKSS